MAEAVRAVYGQQTSNTVMEAKINPQHRRSIFAATDIPAGTWVNLKHLAFKRPGDGIGPGELGKVLESTTNKAVKAGEQLRWEDLDNRG